MRLYRGLILSLWCLLLSVPANATVRVVSWGGAYETAQRSAIFGPFKAETGVAVEILQHDGSSEAMVQRGKAEAWDVVDLTEDQAISACRSGLLRRVDFGKLIFSDPSDSQDFVRGAFRECSVAQNAFASVIAYSDDAFPGTKPGRIEDFFDLDNFPGKRAIEQSPDGILEWALLAEGVPPSQVYDLLSTSRGLRLAFRKMESIRDSIIWWNDVAEPGAFLSTGKAAMASGYNGRFFAAARTAPIVIVWDGRIIGYEVWAIPATSTNVEAALAFIRFAVRPRQMARLAERIPYGPTRLSAMTLIGLDPDKRIPMRLHLPNAPAHPARALVRDSSWYAHTAAIRRKRFEDWLQDK